MMISDNSVEYFRDEKSPECPYYYDGWIEKFGESYECVCCHKIVLMKNNG